MHPINLAVRYLLELVALGALEMWRFHRRDDGWRILLPIAVPLRRAKARPKPDPAPVTAMHLAIGSFATAVLTRSLFLQT
jgi:hypothetical protein